jgi:excisionase family DNA binding protein
MTKTKSDILTILEVARYLKVAERTVYRLAAAKRIPAFKVGGAWRFSRAEIDQWIRRQSSLPSGTDGSSLAGPGRRA